MDFVATQDFATPYVIATGQPHKPTQICKKIFKKGEIITGEIKTANGKPSFVLHKGVMLIPLSCVKQVITKDIVVSTSNFASEVKKTNQPIEVKVKNVVAKNYVHGIMLGAVTGVIGTIIAEKQGWIGEVNSKNKLYGAAIGAVLGCYIVYSKK